MTALPGMQMLLIKELGNGKIAREARGAEEN